MIGPTWDGLWLMPSEYVGRQTALIPLSEVLKQKDHKRKAVLDR